MKKRLLNKIYAKLCGYFWLPCPMCGKMFGGHEWKDGNDLMLSMNHGKGVCPNCGQIAAKRNLEKFGYSH